ncbi:hypothetical protein [Burkholderia cepacia]|nr:hypothetical protein [Burkholderia cepacia]
MAIDETDRLIGFMLLDGQGWPYPLVHLRYRGAIESGRSQENA